MPFRNTILRYLFPLLLILSLGSGFQLFAQPALSSMRAIDLRNNLTIPAGPEASSLGQYGDVGISRHTGALDFSIALASIGDKVLNWNFSLRYDGSGVKPDMLPAQVGQNWSLEGGGVITRSVQGFPDLDNNYYNAVKHWQTTPTEFLDLIHENYFLDSVARGSIETQPDLFSFNFGSFSGKFYIKPDKTIFFEDATDLEIIPAYITNAGGQNGDISSFQIRDAAGFIYTFEYPETTAITYDVNYDFPLANTSYTYHSAWYLKEVKHPNEGMGKITFDYDVVTTPFTPVINNWLTQSMTYTTGPAPDGWNCNQELCGGTAPSTNSASATVAIITNRRFIKEAKFFKGTSAIEKLTFTNANNTCTHAYGGKQLNSLARYTGPGATVENTGWAFSYACREGRLFLSSVYERKSTTAAKPPYSFTYNTTPIPAPGTIDRDYWGYANLNNGSGAIPSYTTPCPGGTTYAGNGVRTPDETRMKAGILTQITYPTGGYTIIDYEGHQVASFDVCLPTLTLVGGLRVKEIRSYAKTGVLAFKKQYKYTAGLGSGDSSGKLLHPFRIGKTTQNQHFPLQAQGECNPLGMSYTCTSVTLNATPTITLDRVSGSHVGYSRVEEINNGKTVYFFRNIVGNASGDNGDVLTKEIYDAADNLLEKTDYTYIIGTTGVLYSMVAEAHDVQDNKSVLCKIIGTNSYEWRLPCCGPGTGTGGCQQSATFQSKLKRNYTTIVSRKKRVTTEVTTYNSQPYTANQTSLIKKTEYQYSYTSALLPTEVKILDGGNNELSRQVMVYPTSGNVPAAMLTKRMYSEPVEVVYYINGSQVYGTKKLYPGSGNVHIPTTIQEKYASGSYADLYLVTQFDTANGNIRSAKRQYDQESSYIYSSDGARITAAVANATINEMAFTSFDHADSYQGGWINLNTAYVKYVVNGGASGNGYYQASAATYLASPALTAGKYIVSYYSKGSPITISNNSGSTTVHRNIYGSDTEHAGGWVYSEHIVSLTHSLRVNIPAGAYLDELRIYPADAQMKSFTYDKNTYLPQCISDVDGKINRFEYDVLNRLITGRDVNDHFVLTHDYFYANTSTYNAVYTRQIQTEGITTTPAAAALTGTDVQRSYAYFDGLGRADQTVALDASPAANDRVSFPQYDTYGRPYREYLPYTVNGTGTAVNNSYRTSATSEQSGFYTALGGNAFTEQILEVSPLSRPQGIKHPGAWNTVPTSVKYSFNATKEVRDARTANAYYAPNTLFKVESKDEDQKTVLTYTDLLGRKVMENRGNTLTYYLYDLVGNITEVIQPEGAKLLHSTAAYTVNTPAVNKFCFRYTYDSRYRMISKYVPGTQAAATYSYDRLDRPVLSTDPNGFKTFTKYDILGRVILTGKYTGTATPQPTDGLFENKTATGHFYTTNLSFPTSATEVYTVQYYDDYDFDGNYTDNYTYSLWTTAEQFIYANEAYRFARGMSTGLKTGVLNTAGTAPTVFAESYPFYDKKGREILTHSVHPYNGTDRMWRQYHFMGWVLHSRLQHTSVLNSVSQTYVVNQRYTYDHAGRLKNTYHKIGDNGTEVLLSENTYGERDELQQKRLAGSQEVDYQYNIRMWLTDINDASGCSATDLFAQRINYNTANANLSAAAHYNGNISSIEWRVGANCQVNGQNRNKAAYGFTYDSQNRLTKAVYGEYNSSNAWQSSALNRYSVNPITYDDNGNITSLIRNGWISGATYGDIDKLTYSYDGDYANQLTAITEISDLTRGFKKISSGADGYEYDNNGNLTADGYRGITSITYNHLNLPAKITYDATKYIELTYDASGRKWKKTTMDRSTTTSKYYFGPIEYNGSTLEALYHEEGRAVPDGNGGYDYEYAIRDHLGSTRVMFEMVNGTATLIEEHHNYPFGMELGGPAFVGGTNPYRYTGKEWETDLDLGLYDFGARWYDPAAGRWWGVDAMADRAPGWTPYRYGFNNPLKFGDPSGNYETDYYYNGKWIGTDNENNNLVAFVTNKENAEEIRKNSESGNLVDKNPALKNGFENSDMFVMNKDVVDQTSALISHAEGLGGDNEVQYVLTKNEDGNYKRTSENIGNKVEYLPGSRAEVGVPPPGDVTIHNHPLNFGISESGTVAYPVDASPNNDLPGFLNYEMNIIFGKSGTNITTVANPNTREITGSDTRPKVVDVYVGSRKRFSTSPSAIHNASMGPSGKTYKKFLKNQ